MAVNKVILIGNVGNDPEVKYIKEDTPFARFRLATSETYKNKSGEKVTNTEWHNIIVWRGLAKVVENYVKKGSKLFIEGKLTYREYEQNGQKKYFTEIVCREMTMLDSKETGATTQKASDEKPPVLNEPVPDEFDDVDDLPF
jgi:single-strand DNA-binding protein